MTDTLHCSVVCPPSWKYRIPIITLVLSAILISYWLYIVPIDFWEKDAPIVVEGEFSLLADTLHTKKQLHQLSYYLAVNVAFNSGIHQKTIPLTVRFSIVFSILLLFANLIWRVHQEQKDQFASSNLQWGPTLLTTCIVTAISPWVLLILFDGDIRSLSVFVFVIPLVPFLTMDRRGLLLLIPVGILNSIQTLLIGSTFLAIWLIFILLSEMYKLLSKICGLALKISGWFAKKNVLYLRYFSTFVYSAIVQTTRLITKFLKWLDTGFAYLLPENPPRWTNILPFLLLSGFVLPHISTDIWCDESFVYTFHLSAIPCKDLLSIYLFGDVHPPLFFLGHLLWGLITPSTILWMRLPHFLLILAVIYLSGCALEKSGGSRWARFALMILLALHPSIHQLASEARMYSWLMFLVTVIWFLEARNKDECKPVGTQTEDCDNQGLRVITVSLMALTHVMGALYAIAWVVEQWVSSKKSKRWNKWHVMVCGSIVFLALHSWSHVTPESVGLPFEVNAIAYHIQQMVVAFLTGIPNTESMLPVILGCYPQLIPIFLLPLILCMIGRSNLRLLGRPFACLAGFLVICLMIENRFHYRYFLLFIPLVFGTLTLSLQRGWRSTLLKMLVFLYASGSLSQMALINQHAWKYWRGPTPLFEQYLSQFPPEQVILHESTKSGSLRSWLGTRFRDNTIAPDVTAYSYGLRFTGRMRPPDHWSWLEGNNNSSLTSPVSEGITILLGETQSVPETIRQNYHPLEAAVYPWGPVSLEYWIFALQPNHSTHSTGERLIRLEGPGAPAPPDSPETTLTLMCSTQGTNHGSPDIALRWRENSWQGTLPRVKDDWGFILLSPCYPYSNSNNYQANMFDQFPPWLFPIKIFSGNRAQGGEIVLHCPLALRSRYSFRLMCTGLIINLLLVISWLFQLYSPPGPEEVSTPVCGNQENDLANQTTHRIFFN